MNEASDQLTMEWRRNVIDKLARQDEVLEEVRKDIVAIRLNTAQSSAISLLEARMESRIRMLEDFKLKLVTLVVAGQIVLSALFSVLARWIFH